MAGIGICVAGRAPFQLPYAPYAPAAPGTARMSFNGIEKPMASARSYVCVEELISLNSLALGACKASQESLSKAITIMAAANGSKQLCGLDGYLVVSGRAMAEDASLHDLEALLDAPLEAGHPVDQVAACVRLLRGDHDDAQVAQRFGRAALQQRLSALLIEFPVLMDSRLVFLFRVPHAEWTSLPVAIAESGFANLPSPADGLSAQQLQRFASNPCVANGLTQPNGSFHSGQGHRALAESTAFRVATNREGSKSPPPVPNATRGGFLVSLLQLNDLARAGSQPHLIDTIQPDFSPAKLYTVLATVVWDITLRGGENTAASWDQVRSALALRSLFALDGHRSGYHRDLDLGRSVASSLVEASLHPTKLSLHIAALLDGELFGTQRATPDSTPSPADQVLLRQRTTQLLQTLVHLGIEPDLHAAGRWVVAATLGHLRGSRAIPAPRATAAAALGFLQAVHEVGVLATALTKPGAAGNSDRWSVWNTWTSVIESFNTAAAMQAVYTACDERPQDQARARDAAPGQAPPAAMVRARRRHI